LGEDQHDGAKSNRDPADGEPGGDPGVEAAVDAGNGTAGEATVPLCADDDHADGEHAGGRDQRRGPRSVAVTLGCASATDAVRREINGDLGASTRRGVDLERSAEKLSALPHDLEPEPVRLRPRVESLAVIANG
jgi:hypothetical protein